MRAWSVHGVELPFGSEPRSWWIDAAGSVQDRPIADAESLPGRFVLPGLADAHAHPAVAGGPAGPVPLDAGAARANLIAWAKTGITVVRDVGSPAGVTLEVSPGPGLPALQAAGRFLAPAGAMPGYPKTQLGMRPATTSSLNAPARVISKQSRFGSRSWDCRTLIALICGFLACGE